MTSTLKKMSSKVQYLYITPFIFTPYYIHILSLWSEKSPLTALDHTAGAFFYLLCPLAIEWAVRYTFRKNSQKK